MKIFIKLLTCISLIAHVNAYCSDHMSYQTPDNSIKLYVECSKELSILDLEKQALKVAISNGKLSQEEYNRHERSLKHHYRYLQGIQKQCATVLEAHNYALPRPTENDL